MTNRRKEATNDGVVTFEQNEKTMIRKITKITERNKRKSSLPPIIQKIFKWQIFRHRFLAFSMRFNIKV